MRVEYATEVYKRDYHGFDTLYTNYVFKMSTHYLILKQLRIFIDPNKYTSAKKIFEDYLHTSSHITKIQIVTYRSYQAHIFTLPTKWLQTSLIQKFKRVDCLVCSDEDLRRNILTDFASINWLTVSNHIYIS